MTARDARQMPCESDHEGSGPGRAASEERAWSAKPARLKLNGGRAAALLFSLRCELLNIRCK